MNFDFPQFAFGKNEVLISVKLNNLLFVLEKQREVFGPYNFEINAFPQASSCRIKLKETNTEPFFGSYIDDGLYYPLTKRFNVEYRSDLAGATNRGYVRWENVIANYEDLGADGDGYFIVLGTGNIVYSNKYGSTSRNVGIGTAGTAVNLTGSTAQNYIVFSALVQTGA
jgi:hypothetical protein